MVKFLPSKQAMRVRFPLPAPSLRIRELPNNPSWNRSLDFEKGTTKGTKLAEKSNDFCDVGQFGIGLRCGNRLRRVAFGESAPFTRAS